MEYAVAMMPDNPEFAESPADLSWCIAAAVEVFRRRVSFPNRVETRSGPGEPKPDGLQQNATDVPSIDK